MITYFLTCFLSAICIVTTWRLFNDDASFMGHLAYILDSLPSWVKKPLYECMFCMSSIWGASYFMLFTWLFELQFGIVKVILSILVIAGFVTILQGIALILDWLLTLTKMLKSE